MSVGLLRLDIGLLDLNRDVRLLRLDIWLPGLDASSPGLDASSPGLGRLDDYRGIGKLLGFHFWRRGRIGGRRRKGYQFTQFSPFSISFPCGGVCRMKLTSPKILKYLLLGIWSE
jgi:hypothetical protein